MPRKKSVATVKNKTVITADMKHAADAIFNENVLTTMAPNTRKAYDKNWRAFLAWTAAAGVSALPAAPESVAVYIRYLQDSGKSYSTICQAIMSINKAHQINRIEAPHSAGIDLARKAAARKIGRAPKQKDAMTIDILTTIIDSMKDDNSLKAKRDCALLAVGFMGAFRRSELSALKISDLTYKPGKNGRPLITIYVRRSKTDQTGTGMHKAIFTSTGPVDAVKLVLLWINAAGLKGDDYLFPAIGKGGRVKVTPIRGADIARMIKCRAAAAGVILQNLSGHSMRRGFITSAINAGASERSIMNQSGHNSVTTMRRYIERVAVENDNAASLF